MDAPIKGSLVERFNLRHTSKRWASAGRERGLRSGQMAGSKKPIQGQLKSVFKGQLGSQKTFLKQASNLQNSTVKISYLPTKDEFGKEKNWAKHGQYLQRAGTQKKIDELGLGFNALRNEIKIGKTMRAWQQAGDEHVFKVIISPEQGHRLDLKEHVRAVMKAVINDLGPVEWCGICHYNTDDFHAHVVIKGKDQYGKTLIIPKDYIKNGFRQRSREEATKALGIRLKSDILARRLKVITAEHITEMDREISQKMVKMGSVSKTDFILTDPENGRKLLNGEPILKEKLSEIASIKGTILDPEKEKSVWRKVTTSKVRLKADIEIKAESIMALAKGDFDKVYALVKQSQGLIKSGFLKAYPAGKLRLENQDSGRPKELADTRFDALWKSLKEPFSNVLMLEEMPNNSFLQVKRSHLIARLGFLKQLGLAQKESTAVWRIDPGFIDYLKFRQLQKDIIKSRNLYTDNITNKQLQTVFNKLETPGDFVLGKVAGMGVNERLYDTRFLLIEGTDGRVHYVPQTPRISRQIDNFEIKNGDLLFIENRSFAKDRSDGTVLRHRFDYQKLEFDTLIPKLAERGYIDENNKVSPTFKQLDADFKDSFRYRTPEFLPSEFNDKIKERDLIDALKARGIKVPDGEGIKYINEVILKDKMIFEKYSDILTNNDKERVADFNWYAPSEVQAVNRSIIERGDHQKVPNSLRDFTEEQFKQIEAILNETKPILYLYAKTVDNFKAWEKSNEINDTDIYLTKILKKLGKLPEAYERDNDLRKEFLKSAQERIRHLKQRGLLNEKFELINQNRGRAL